MLTSKEQNTWREHVIDRVESYIRDALLCDVEWVLDRNTTVKENTEALAICESVIRSFQHGLKSKLHLLEIYDGKASSQH